MNQISDLVLPNNLTLNLGRPQKKEKAKYFLWLEFYIRRAIAI